MRMTNGGWRIVGCGMREAGEVSRRPRLPLSSLLLLLGLFVMAPGCDGGGGTAEEPEPAPALFNLAHLEHLTETVTRGTATLALVHIYAEAPTYAWVADDDEGASALDDVARAAVVYLRHYEFTGDAHARERAEQLLRFVLYMQREDGLFYNFVWDNTLRINTEHPNSRADVFAFWAARAVWALGTGARVLAGVNPALAEACAAAIRRTYPHLDALLARYGQTFARDGLTYPRWLVHETAADATSELLLGLTSLQRTAPDPALQQRIDRFAEGLARMQYGSMNRFPWAAHASFLGEWHGWGNSQTQALAETGRLESARREAEQFYPRLLIDGWMHSFRLNDPASVRRYEQIAYAVRCVAVGLIRLYEATGEARYATMAGLAASWFTGNNVAGVALYDPATGRGFDGINGPDDVNRNAGAESTIEALMTLLEVERHEAARTWLHARGEAPVETTRDGTTYRYRVFTVQDGGTTRRLALVMNLTRETLDLLEGDALDAFLQP